MTTFTIHAEPVMAEALRRAAAEADLSINKYILRQLGSALGLMRSTEKRKLPSFLDIPRTISEADADRLLAVQSDFEQIDEDAWK